MAEKKKRVRPTVAQVRALEAKIAELEKGMGNAVPIAKFNEVLMREEAVIKTNGELLKKVSLLDSEVEFHKEIAADRAAEVERLRKRNLFERLFNL
jgi:hypothetical protein